MLITQQAQDNETTVPQTTDSLTVQSTAVDGKTTLIEEYTSTQNPILSTISSILSTVGINIFTTEEFNSASDITTVSNGETDISSTLSGM